MFTPQDSEICRALISACSTVDHTPEFQAAHYATDASILASSDMPAVVFGPGDIAMAHTDKECIEVSQIEKAAEIMVALLTDKTL